MKQSLNLMEQRLKKAPVLAAGFLGMIFFGVAFVIMGAVLPSLIDKFELNTASASTLAGLLPLGILLGSVLFGPVIDRFGYKILIITSSIVTIAGLELLSFASTVPWIRFSIFLIGVGGGTLNGLTNALVSDISDSSNRASNLSILGVFYTIGAIAVPILFATLSKSFSYNILVSRAGVIMIFPVIYYCFINFPQAKFKQGIPISKVISMAKEPFLIVMSFVLFFQSGMEGLSNNWIPAYLESETQINSSIAMYALTSIILGVGAGRIVLSYLLRKISKQVVLISSMIISVIGVIILLTTAQPLIGTFLLGLGFASTFPIVLGQLGEKYKEMSGTAFSFALVVALSGNVLLNLLVGVVSLSNLLFVLLLCITAIILLYSISLSFNK
ncbi:MAG: MFS transporter [Bacteroidales bacterium]|nr:MFS transporter [Bacteroidales bacterium]